MLKNYLVIVVPVVVLILAVLLTVELVTVVSNAQAGEEPAAETEFGLVGSKQCKKCHKKESVGAQYLKWQETKHSKAFEALGTPEAAAFAAERGIEGSPQQAMECLKCHSTAYAMTTEQLAGSKISIEEGVSCESCHGPGSVYGKKKAMQKITDGELDAASVGLFYPTEEVCLGCHNDESPSFEGFDFDEYYEKIVHLRPVTEGTGD